MTSLSRTDRSRARILEAAHTIFRTAGIEAASMEEIARLAGLTRKTLYNHFASKQDIALALIARVEAGDAAYRASMAAGEPALDLIERVLLDSAHWCLDNPGLARLALSPVQRPTIDPPEDRPSFQGLVRDLLALGQRQNRVRTDRDVNFMTLVLLAVYGQAMLTVLSGAPFHEKQIRDLVRIVVEGIGQNRQ